MKLIRIIGDAEPVSLEEMKSFLRVDIPNDDELIKSLISAARNAAEGATNRAIIRQELACVIEVPGKVIEVPRPPLVSVTVTGARVERIDSTSEPGKVYLAEQPTGPVTLQFTCGYETPEQVPPRIKQAIKLIVASWYDNRALVGTPGTPTRELPFAASALLSLDRVVNV